MGAQTGLQTGKCQLGGTQAAPVLHHSGHLRKEVKKLAGGGPGGIRRLLAAAVLKRLRLGCYRCHPAVTNCAKCSRTKISNYLVKIKWLNHNH